MEQLEPINSSEDEVNSLVVETSHNVSVYEKTRKKFISKVKKPHIKSKLSIKRCHTLQKIFKNRNQFRSEYYPSEASGVNAQNQRDVLGEPSPFKIIKDQEIASYKVAIRAWKAKRIDYEQDLSVTERPSQRSRQTTDLLKRTFVPPQENVVHTITDIDPDWFEIVQGRPTATKSSTPVYIDNLRNCLLTKLRASWNEDEIMRIEESYNEELKTIEMLNDKYLSYVKSFEEMLSNDHSKSMQLLDKAEQMMKKTAEKDTQLKNLSKQLGILNVKIYSLEEKWRNRKIYQKFLYQIAPMSWRRQYDYIHRQSDGTILGWESLFTNSTLKRSESITSINDLIDTFLQDIAIQDEPVMYFTRPYEIVQVFHELELQNLDSLLHSEELATPMKNMQLSLIETKRNLDIEYNTMQEMINETEKEIEWYEDQMAKLIENTQEILTTTFRKLIADKKALILYNNVEDVYEILIGSNDSKLGIVEMMKEIEVHYEKLMLQLDTISFEAVKSAELEAYAEEFRIMKQAKDAAKKVQLIDELTYKLKRVLEPPAYRTVRELKPRSSLSERKQKKKHGVKQPLTNEEIEYLIFFTKWFLGEDPTKFGISNKK